MSFNSEDRHIVVNYHYVEDPRPDFSGIFPCSVAEFERQVKFLSENYKIVSVPEVFEAARSNSSERVCAITFDDGLRDQYENALPILQKYGATATFFIITGTFDGLVPSAHKIHVVLSRIKAAELIDVFNDFLASERPDMVLKYKIPKDRRITERRIYDDVLNANFKETLTIIPADLKDAFLARVFDDFKINTAEINKMLFMNKAEVGDLARRGFHAECHTHGHASLENISADAVAGDLQKSNSVLETIIGRKSSVLSYPHGRFSNEARSAILAAGFKHGVTIEPRGVATGDDPLFIPRYDTNNLRDYLNK